MIRRNILANFAGRAWGFVAVYVFFPLYVSLLGMEAFGLVGFYATLLGVLALADMGFTATLTREMARLSATPDSAGPMRELLRTYEITYAAISLALTLLIWVLAPVIAERWLRSPALNPDDIATAIRLMGIAIAFQLPSGLFVGGLMGLQRQVRANSVQIGWSLSLGVGAVLVLTFVAPTIVAFAAWQVGANALYCAVARSSVWRALPSTGERGNPRFNRQVLRETWRYAAAMAGISLIGIGLTQIDKLVVSKMLSLEMLGYYALAAVVASIPITLAGVIGAAVFPRLTNLVASADRTSLASVYNKAFDLVAVLILPTGLTLAAFPAVFVFAWTGSQTTAQNVAPAAGLLVMGQLLQSLTVIPYYLGLAHGSTKLNVRLGVASIVVITPLLVYLIAKFGILGAGLSWLVLNVCALPINLYFFHHWFLPGSLTRSLRVLGIATLAAVPMVLLSRALLPHPSSRLLASAELVVTWALAVAAATFLVPGFRQTVRGDALSLLATVRSR